MNTSPVSQAPAVVPAAFASHVSSRELVAALEALGGTNVIAQGREIAFLFEQRAGRTVIRIIDRATGDVIQQLPAAYVVRLERFLRQQR